MAKQAKIEEGAFVVLECRIDIVLDDGSIVIKVPGYGIPVRIRLTGEETIIPKPKERYTLRDRPD